MNSHNWINVERNVLKSKVYQPSNIYETAVIGKGVNIGAFSEIGERVHIGDNTRIGAFAFIPEGVCIHGNCFIGPRVTFTNDKFPPSGKENWAPTLVKEGARIGAGVTILPGITIGAGALVGAGSVVTHDVPDFTMVYGNPARDYGTISGSSV